MNILFLHRNFPGQFKYLINELLKSAENNVIFVTNNSTTKVEGVKKLVYEIQAKPKDENGYLSFFEEDITHANAAAKVLTKLKNERVVPDIIYGHSWGETLFVKDIFPDIPFVCYFEWFYNPVDTDFDFYIKNQTDEQKAKLRCKNSSILLDLQSCDRGITPTNWQKAQFPKEFQNKIKVIHDGVDTEFFKPDSAALFEVNNLKLSAKNEVVTYATRGMEPYRGFPNFMKAVEILLKKRPQVQVVIAGEDQAFYGMKLEGNTYKKLMFEECDIDLSRVHFVGKLPYEKYLNLLQISSAHVYLTVPFVLSWSMLEAMSCACCVVASNTQPVVEVIKDNHNGLLFDFFNISQQVEKIEFALNNRQKAIEIGKNARNSIEENYSLDKTLPAQIKLLKGLV